MATASLEERRPRREGIEFKHRRAALNSQQQHKPQFTVPFCRHGLGFGSTVCLQRPAAISDPGDNFLFTERYTAASFGR
jgi:hypothetical protein